VSKKLDGMPECLCADAPQFSAAFEQYVKQPIIKTYLMLVESHNQMSQKAE